VALDLMVDPPEKTQWEEVDRPDLAARSATLSR
jgi:hypothetical protein